MNISIVRYISPASLEESLRRVPLKGDGKSNTVYPYSKSNIVLRDMHPDELNPGSLYLLQSSFDFQQRLRDLLTRQHGIDPLQLEGGYVLRDDDTKQEWSLIPPIVEVTEENMSYVQGDHDVSVPGETRVRMNVIVDGLHRLKLAQIANQMTRVIHISRIDHPFYAFPNRWEEVRILQEVPKREEKKHYRFKDPYPHYRDFGVLNCGAPRER